MVMEEVLFEYKDSKREIHLDRATVCADVERELNRFGFKNVYVCLCGIEGATFEGKEIFLLQRWSRKWNTFVDVNCTEELNAGDKITVTPTKVKDGYEGAQSILKRVSKPTDVEVKELAKFFPSYRQKQKAGPSGFNPNADCVIAENKKKKKAAVKRKPKDSNVTVVLMGKYSPSVPKGKVRQKLATDGRMQSIRVSREMSSQEIRNTIIRVFNCSKYTVLEVDSSGHTLCKCSEQDIDGEAVVDRKGCLYLCETFPDTSSHKHLARSVLDPDSDFETPPKKTRKASLVTKPLPVVLVSSSESDSESEDQKELLEWRKIRQDQDEAYALSLQCDMQKDRERDTKMHLEKVRDNLKKKWTPNSVDGDRFTLRLSPSNKIDVSVAKDLKAKVLYEIAFTFGTFETSFSLFAVLPRTCVSEDMSISDVASMSRVLSVENGTDPIDIHLFMQTTNDVASALKEMKPTTDESVAEQVDSEVMHEVDTMRIKFMTDDVHLDTHHGLPRHFSRNRIYQDVIDTFRDDLTCVLGEFPFRVKFDGERAVDTGGVCRDMYSCFWEAAYIKHFDGERLLVPAVNPGVDMWYDNLTWVFG